MTALMDEALQRLRSVAEERQDAVARLVLLVTEAEADDDLTVADIQAIERSRACAARGDFAADDEIEAVWAKNGL